MKRVNFKSFLKHTAAITLCFAATTLFFASCETDEETDESVVADGLTIVDKPSGGVTVQVYSYSGAAPATEAEFYQIYAQHLTADKAVAVGVSTSSPVALSSLSNGKPFVSNSLHTVLIILSGTEG